MQPHSSAPPPHRPSARPGFKPSPDTSPQPANNEFADAVARMFEKRQRGDSAPVVPPRIDFDEGDDTPPLLGRMLGDGGARRTLLLVPLAVLGFSLAWWFVSPEPSQGVTTGTVASAGLDPQQPVEAPAPPTPSRPAAVEVKAPPPVSPPPAAPQAAALQPQPTPPAAPDLRPLSREEIKELQGKLGLIGFAAGPVDGVMGPQTQAALKRYGETRSVKAEPNRDLLFRVRSEAAAKP